MSYSIVYPGSEKYDRRRHAKPLSGSAVALMITVAIFLSFFHPGVRRIAYDICFPRAGESVLATAEEAFSDILKGESINDAVYAFCQEIIGSGQD